jgi:hypothetical protein
MQAVKDGDERTGLFTTARDAFLAIWIYKTFIQRNKYLNSDVVSQEDHPPYV